MLLELAAIIGAFKMRKELGNAVDTIATTMKIANNFARNTVAEIAIGQEDDMQNLCKRLSKKAQVTINETVSQESFSFAERMRLYDAEIEKLFKQ